MLVARRRKRIGGNWSQDLDPTGQFRATAGRRHYRRGNSPDAAIETAVKHWWGLDLVINNAGIGTRGRFAEASPERLREDHGGEFLRTGTIDPRGDSSALSKDAPADRGECRLDSGSPWHSSSPPTIAPANSRLRGLSESLRRNWRRCHIDLLLVSPGRTETPFLEAFLGAGRRRLG